MATDDTVTVDAEEYRKYKAAYVDARTAYERLAGIPAAMFREGAPDVPEA